MSDNQVPRVMSMTRDIAHHCKSIREDSNTDNMTDLPSAFQGVANALPAIEKAYGAAHKQMRTRNKDLSFAMMKPGFEKTAENIGHIKELFLSASSSPPETMIDEYHKASQRICSGKPVEVLLKDAIQQTISALKADGAFSSAMEPQINDLRKALEDVSKIPRSLPEERAFINYGSGAQNIQAGSGPQFNNTGAGPQIIGGTIHKLG